MRRSNNQDAHAEILARDVAAWYERGHLFMVADGMGAHAAGELASQMAIASVSKHYHAQSDTPPHEAIESAIHSANKEIHNRGESRAEFHRMGTTCTVALLLPQGVMVAHVGDSRVYRLRGKKLQQLTFDHSLAWEMQAARRKTGYDDENLAIPKNVITRSLGPHPAVQIDLEGPFDNEVGDTYLLCSDGLTCRVDDHEIAIVLTYLDPDSATRFLVDLANVRGGPDNITVTIFQITGTEISTHGASAEPLVATNEQPSKRPIHHFVWLVLAASLMATVGFGLVDRVILALVSALVAAAAVAASLVQGLGLFDRTGVPHAKVNRFGGAPYVKRNTPAADDFLRTISEQIAGWKEIAETGNWDADWSECAHYLAMAEQRIQDQDVAAALREYGQALHRLVPEIRTHQNDWANTSSVDL